MQTTETTTVLIDLDGDYLYDVWSYIGAKQPADAKVFGQLRLEYQGEFEHE